MARIGGVALVIILFSVIALAVAGVAGLTGAGILGDDGMVADVMGHEPVMTPNETGDRPGVVDANDFEQAVVWHETTFELTCYVPWCFDPPNGTVTLEVWAVGNQSSHLAHRTVVGEDIDATLPLRGDKVYRVLLYAPSGEAIVVGLYTPDTSSTIVIEARTELSDVDTVTPTPTPMPTADTWSGGDAGEFGSPTPTVTP